MNTGISVYVGLKDYPIEKSIEYLKLAKKLGCDYVFSSAHINEASSAENELQMIIDTCLELDMKISLDISKPMMDKIKLPNHVFALRLDYGFSEEEIIDLSNNAPYLVELNASTISVFKLERLIKNGLNVERTRMSFNFYPKLYTGHDLETVFRKTELFKEMGMTVFAFISSHNGFRPPMYEGLPTVESHRNLKLASAIEELKACNVDGVYFGDAYATEEEISLLNHHQCDEIILPLRINDGFYDLDSKLNGIYNVRTDINRLMLRISGTRTNEKVNCYNTVTRKYLDVTMDNYLFKRYMGEINIILTALPMDERVNVIGKIDTTPFVINAVKLGRKFKFEIIEKG